MDSAYFSGRSGGWKKFFPKIFFCFQNLDALYRPVVGKPFVIEDLCFGMGTSVASALTAESISEIIKCMSDVDMRGRWRMGSKCEIFRFLADRTIGRAFVTRCRLSVCCLSVTFCIEAKRYVLAKNCLKEQIGLPPETTSRYQFGPPFLP